MIMLENTEVLGWEAAIRGMRNPMNSWSKSDSLFICYDYCDNKDWGLVKRCSGHTPIIKENDLSLMSKLCAAGTDHRKFMRMITVYVDVSAPLYWWKEFDTYKVGTVANSCSTMHKIADKEFTLDDFSHEHLLKAEPIPCRDYSAFGMMKATIENLNHYRELYLETKDKLYWWQMIQLLPSSYNQRRTVMLNYEVLANMYKSRKNHKLDEWHIFCDWISALPYSLLITVEEFNLRECALTPDEKKEEAELGVFIAGRSKIVCAGDCYHVKNIKPENQRYYHSLEEAIKDGCRLCKHCHGEYKNK